MPIKDKKRQRKASRECMRRKRALEAQKEEIETVNHGVNLEDMVIKPITDADIDNLPSSLKFQIDAETNVRAILKMSDNIRERQEAMVRRFRGY